MIVNHKCKEMKKEDSIYQHNGKWFFEPSHEGMDNVDVEINFCPYCGEKLEK
jgi:hypothetical protein